MFTFPIFKRDLNLEMKVENVNALHIHVTHYSFSSLKYNFPLQYYKIKLMWTVTEKINSY